MADKFEDEEHQAAYIFNPLDDEGESASTGAAASARPSKRRKVGASLQKAQQQKKQRRSRGVAAAATATSTATEGSLPAATTIGFTPLLNGLESPAFVRRREQLYATGWARIEGAIRHVLRRANGATLDRVCAFVAPGDGDGRGHGHGHDDPTAPYFGGRTPGDGKLPAAFIVTGPNVSSRGLLFAQLAERLQVRGLGQRQGGERGDEEEEEEEEEGEEEVSGGVGGEGEGEGEGRDDREQQAARGGGWFVRVSSGEAGSLKSVLKKIIRDVTSRNDELVAGGDEDGEEEDLELTRVGPTSSGQRVRRKYLDYDPEALHEFLKSRSGGASSSRSRPLQRQPQERVYVAFEDSEAFDSGVLSDLVLLLHSWRDRVRFTLLFGIGTSVELFQARMLHAACQRLDGRQFDVVRADAILDRIFRECIAAADAPLVLGAVFLDHLQRRQREQATSVQIFISSLKYAYLCHFNANALSALVPNEAVPFEDTADDDQEENLQIPFQLHHLDAIRTLPSFSREVYASISGGELRHARKLLEDDDYLASFVERQLGQWQEWQRSIARSLQLIAASEAVSNATFADMYINVMHEGLSAQGLTGPIRRMNVDDLAAMLQRIIRSVGSKSGASRSKPRPRHTDGDHVDFEGLALELGVILKDLEALQVRATESKKPLRSKYNAQGKVLRTTVVAQKVQLSRDTAELTADDQAFTELVDGVTDALEAELKGCSAADDWFLHEAWLFDNTSPHQEVFVPEPGATFKSALSRPHDYLDCICCKPSGGGDVGGISPMLPATSILYHLYLETGSLVNVADLWTAFCGQVLSEEDDEEVDDNSNNNNNNTQAQCNDERTALVLFYQGLAELRAMGFVQSTRKKEDHVAKVKWL